MKMYQNKSFNRDHRLHYSRYRTSFLSCICVNIQRFSYLVFISINRKIFYYDIKCFDVFNVCFMLFDDGSISQKNQLLFMRIPSVQQPFKYKSFDVFPSRRYKIKQFDSFDGIISNFSSNLFGNQSVKSIKITLLKPNPRAGIRNIHQFCPDVNFIISRMEITGR